MSCEINKHKGDKSTKFNASTPPLEARRMTFSRFASELVRCKGEVEMTLQMGFVDIRKAFLDGIPRRSVDMDLPREMCLGIA